jgi:hypothetical protein
MTSQDDVNNHYGDEDPLVDRLRRLAWPTVDPELRERCWEDFQRLLADPGAVREKPVLGGAPAATRRSVARRQDFTRRLSGCARTSVGEPLGAYATVRFPWSQTRRTAVSLTG